MSKTSPTTSFRDESSAHLVDQLEDVVRDEEAAAGVLHQVEGLREVHGVLAVVDLFGTKEKYGQPLCCAKALGESWVNSNGQLGALGTAAGADA